MPAVLQIARLATASVACALVVGCLGLASCSYTDYSVDNEQGFSVVDRGIMASEGEETPIAFTGKEAAREVFRRAAESCLTSVEIGRSLQITQDDLTEVIEEMRFTPEYLCATGQFTFQMYAPTEDDDFYACSLELGYDYDPELVPQYRAQLKATANDIVGRLVTPGMSDYDKALVLHDYLFENCRYDLSLTSPTAYDALVGRCATCLGYCQAYKMLLELAGVESDYATSKSMEHRWNMVRVDGEWYHVDVTWDDPVVDDGGELDEPSYSNFLKSDDTMIETGHYDWTAKHEAPTDYAA